MPNPTAPVKTPLGLEELRHRTRGLGQRYRTVLLLVDGRRPLGEVLGMAHKAGAQTGHFEELVRMGLVEIPSEGAAPEPVETIPGALDTPRLTSVEVDVFADAALTPMGELLPEPDDEPASAMGSAPRAPAAQEIDEIENEPVARFTEIEMGAPQVLPIVEVASIAQPPPAPAPAARYQEPAVVLSDTPRAPDWMQQVRETPFKVADHARPAPRMTEEQRLQYVRDLLLDTLRRDSLLFATFSVGRVKSALTQKELIKLVWEVERDRAHTRRTRDQLLNLQRARELLGMGNTLVAGDSQPGPVSEY
ncbi:MAG: hypothetical protein H7Y33_01750 [Cytophagales bacterium]|nr:hypothetical protein [Rhizobacter sp.]